MKESKQLASLRTLKLICAICLLLVLGSSLQSCYYDVEETLYPSITCDTAMVTYSNDIVPILENNCMNCHNTASSFGNVSLEGYFNLKTYVDNNKLLGVIRHEPGFPPMPQGQAQLLECEIAKVEKWILDGAPQN